MVAMHRRTNRFSEIFDKKNQIQSDINEVLRNNLELLIGKANTAQSIKERIAEIGRIIDRHTS